ncbi:E3 ubiquitin-protein ligase ATL41 [Zea mays]|jgi:hypothetical protein|uniref:RING-type E3 ubiquitin transferase n=1 Tax=Zea mays TaxID=4577 RepID=B4FRY7_MAIZE|nr:E3 ubiquitin-protein ligase ATL41 [Zea mays]ACF84880.1 unknown [Zea mays]ONM31705.1 RING-H2 finger protein ATL3 [Zea mays]|eukprot:NP_001167698.2 uncharacterized protein LOC100278939 [Zea mays]
MGVSDGDGNGNGPKASEEAVSCEGSPEYRLPFSKPHVPSPPQVTDPTNYAMTGKILLAAAGAFAGVLLALVALHLYNSTRRRRLGGNQRRLFRSLAIAGGDEDRRDGDGEGAPPPHRGLDSAVLAAIPVVLIEAGADAGGGDCAVCLAELEPGEKARALPRCGHRFHIECIGAWFRGNATCPLCRADVVVVAPGAIVPAEGGALSEEVRIDVAGDAVAATPNGSTVVPVMGRLHSGRDLEKARRVFASTRFSSF